jgi:L-ascorbate metabolism protein UlaG (beta-lactamase superfamily)
VEKLKSILILLLILAASGSFVFSRGPAETCAVTYIANEGLLIKTATHKILIDALFGNIKGNWCDQPSDSVSRMMQKGISPFDNIDIVLVTHKHSDHFNESIVINFLKNNQKSMLICPDQVNEILKTNPEYSLVSGRITSLRSCDPYDSSLTIKNINIRAFSFNHGPYFETDPVTGKTNDRHRDIQNIGYIIESDGFLMFHSGDCSASAKAKFELYGFEKKEFNIVFVDRIFLRKEGQEVLQTYVRSENIIFIHIEPGKGAYYQSVINSIPEMSVFVNPMETKIFTK